MGTRSCVADFKTNGSPGGRSAERYTCATRFSPREGRLLVLRKYNPITFASRSDCSELVRTAKLFAVRLSLISSQTLLSVGNGKFPPRRSPNKGGRVRPTRLPFPSSLSICRQKVHFMKLGDGTGHCQFEAGLVG